MKPRAAPMPAQDRRQAIIEAALPLIRERGRAATTKQIAEAAAIAEGTIFRVFESKDDIFEAVLDHVFDPHGFIADLDAVDPGGSLRERLVALTTLLQRRFYAIFTLMTALAIPAPASRHRGGDEDWRQEVLDRMVALLEPDRDAFRTAPEEVIRVLRLLTFAGSHPHITDQQLLTPDEIVDVVLHGTLKTPKAGD